MEDYKGFVKYCEGNGLIGGHDIILDAVKRRLAMDELRKTYKGKTLAAKSPYTLTKAPAMANRRMATVVPPIQDYFANNPLDYENAIRNAKVWKKWVSNVRKQLNLKKSYVHSAAKKKVAKATPPNRRITLRWTPPNRRLTLRWTPPSKNVSSVSPVQSPVQVVSTKDGGTRRRITPTLIPYSEANVSSSKTPPSHKDKSGFSTRYEDTVESIARFMLPGYSDEANKQDLLQQFSEHDKKYKIKPSLVSEKKRQKRIRKEVSSGDLPLTPEAFSRRYEKTLKKLEKRHKK